MRRKFISKRGVIVSLRAAIVVGCIIHFRDPCNNPLNDDFYCRVKAVWEIPADASDIVFEESGSGYWSGNKLRFKASSAGLPNFIRHFCEGFLHQGYDPYRAFNYGGRLGGQRFHLIKDTTHRFSYYSYSPDTPDTVSGNRCQGELLSQIRVEQVEPDLYDVRVDQGRHLWGNNCSLIPCRYIGENFVQPIPDLPFVVMGLDADSSNQFILVSNELCLEYQWTDYHFASVADPYSAPGLAYLHDAKLNWIIDNQSQGSAVISAQYASLLRENGEERYYGELNYCTMQDWTPGIHQMALEVVTTVGQRDTYTWDRANRLISMGGASYQYDGEGRRVQQTVGATVTKYLLDLQPGLSVVLAETTGANIIRNVHAPRGIHAHKDAAGAWEWMVQDGLGSVREVVDNSVGVLESRNYDPYGVGFDATGSNQTAYGFTGEPTDDNGLLYLRARYYNPAVGVFTALDPFEGMWDEPMSINGYSYVHGNPVNLTDPSGMIFWAFPTSSRDLIESPLQYSTNRPAHAWIEYWLEIANGFYKTHLEFPGLANQAKIDAIVFDANLLTSFSQEPSSVFGYLGGSVGGVYEIEPALPISKIVSGYIEVLIKWSQIDYGLPPFAHQGVIAPNGDRWNPSRPAPGFVGAPYDWSGVRWILGDRLSSLIDIGPVRVDPNQLGGLTNIPDAYWIALIVDGLILYVSERDMRNRGYALTAAGAAALIWEMYKRAQASRPGGALPQPKPIPVGATDTALTMLELSEDGAWCTWLNGGSCNMPDFTPPNYTPIPGLEPILPFTLPGQETQPVLPFDF